MKSIFDKKFRLGIESFLIMYLNKYQFVLGADLDDYSKVGDLFDDKSPCNIYFVLRRPKVTIDPNSITINKKEVEFNLLVHIRDKIKVVNAYCKFLKAKSKIEYLAPYPYNFIAFRDQEKLLMMARPSTLLDSKVVAENIEDKDLDYEVLYIGQAYGKNGKRTALNRLPVHETVQKIYTQASALYPDSDIWFMLTNFAQQSILIGMGSSLEITEEDSNLELEKINHMFDNNGHLISEKQKINFTEAALIKYFQPKYNIEFKNNFPSAKHKSYSECYHLDIKALTIELDTSEMSRKIYTEKTGRKIHHQKMFEFNSDDDRISLLEIFK